MGRTDSAFIRIAQSTVVTFLVGIDNTPMVIHAAAIEGLSVPLRNMVKDSSMKDSTGGVVALDNTTFEAFQALPSLRTLATIHVPWRGIALRVRKNAKQTKPT